jgi:hypothetical protein
MFAVGAGPFPAPAVKSVQIFISNFSGNSPGIFIQDKFGTSGTK